MHNCENFFLRRMPTLFVAARLFGRIDKQILLESRFNIRSKAVYDQPSGKVRSGENFAVSVFCDIVIANFDTDAAEVF